jgi:GH43 family beta-xylosidase
MRLIPYKEGQYSSQADPFLIRAEDGAFYMYVTGNDGVHAFRSETLCGEYEDIGTVFSVEHGKSYWAPAVVFAEGKYYMYVSFMPKDETDCHLQALHAAVSDSPAGPFTDAGRLAAPFSIDAHPVVNRAGMFLFYSVNDYEAERAGTYIVADRLKTPTQLCGEPVDILRPSLDEEIFQRDRFRAGQHWHTLEGACYFREGDFHYIIYSGNCYENEYYYLGYAVAESPEDDLTKLHFEKFPDADTYAPLIAKNSWEEGTGHNSVLKMDGEYYVIYHGRDCRPDERVRGDRRTARICRLEVNGRTLTAHRYEDHL